MTVLSITQAELDAVQSLADQGRISEGWGILADRGDAYAYFVKGARLKLNPTLPTTVLASPAPSPGCQRLTFRRHGAGHGFEIRSPMGLFRRR